MVERLIELLETFKKPVIRQGSLGPAEAYPETFFTFWNNNETLHSAYDNEDASAEVAFDVNVYSTDPSTAYDLLEQARALLKGAGFIITTRAYDVASDEITHTGRGFQVAYLQTLDL